MPDFIENPIQKEAIRFASGVMQVLAGPGSGKTFVTIQRIRYLIEECKVKPENILVITFTKAAADEMKHRFYRLMEEQSLPVTFGTFHAVFYHILRQTGQYHSYSLITESEKKKLLRQLFRMSPYKMGNSAEKIDAMLQSISRLKNQGEETRTVSQDTFSKEELQYFYQEYNQYLSQFQKLDFDDMGLLCRKLFQEKPQLLVKWQEVYRYILVDEFQDINEIQYQIVKDLAGKTPNLFVVGDDDQSIYGFRGARPDIMKRFLTDYPQAKQLLLNVNYRCHEQIVKKSLQVIEADKNRFAKKIKAVHADGEGVILQSFENREKEQDWLLAELKRKLETEAPEKLSKMAIIYRTNQQCSLLAEKLLLHGIPFQMKEVLHSQFDHFVIKDLMAYLEFANENQDRELFHLFMNRPLRYLKKDCARKEQTTIKEVLSFYHDNPSMQAVVRKLFQEIGQLRGRRPYLALQYIRKVIGYDKFLQENNSMEESKKLLQIADDFQNLSRNFSSFQELNDYISQCQKLVREKQAEKNCMEHEKGKTKEQTGVHLLTMHMAKGLEFDTVYLPDLNEGKIPMRQAVMAAEIEEERRMLYVAMTRAKQDLYLMFCKQGTGKAIPSRFLEPVLSENYSGSSTISSNSTESKYSSKASSTASYSSSSSMYSREGSSSGFSSSSK